MASSVDGNNKDHRFLKFDVGTHLKFQYMAPIGALVFVCFGDTLLEVKVVI